MWRGIWSFKIYLNVNLKLILNVQSLREQMEEEEENIQQQQVIHAPQPMVNKN
jgi:hypothetical protein